MSNLSAPQGNTQSPQGSNSLYIRPDSSGNLGIFNSSGVEIARIKGNAGLGIPSIVLDANFLAVNASAQSLGSITTPNDGNKHSYEINWFVNITTLGSASFSMQLSFVDENGISHTPNLNASALANTSIVSTMSVAAYYLGYTIRITCNPNTTISLSTTGTFTGSVYDCGATVKQLD
jgi:hypothetical protein